MEFYVGKNGRVFGPYYLDEIQRRLDEGRINGSELVWYKRRVGWVPLAKDEIFQADIDSRKYLVTLLELRDQLHHQMRELRKEAAEETETHSMHMADSGTDSFDRDLVLSTISADQDILYEIDEAISRIENNTYGICEISGKQIPNDRLDALPWARFTVETQSRLENGGNLPQRKLGRLKNLMGTEPTVSPSALVLEEEKNTANPDTNNGGFIEEKASENPGELASISDDKVKLGEVLTSLSEHERKVLELRFGLKDCERSTLEEIGKQFGVTCERICQIEANALNRLRHPSRLNELAELHDRGDVSVNQKDRLTDKPSATEQHKHEEQTSPTRPPFTQLDEESPIEDMPPEFGVKTEDESLTSSITVKEPSIWILHGDDQHGPYPLEQIEQFIVDGLLDGSELAWQDGLEDWIGLSNLLGIDAPNKSEDTKIEAVDPHLDNEPGIWILHGDDQLGPYPLEQINQFVVDGLLDGSELAWIEGLEDWIDIHRLLSELDAKESKSAAHN